MSFAPMLCVLFIGARMRALQIDPVNGNPQKWAQTCFYICAYSVRLPCREIRGGNKEGRKEGKRGVGVKEV